MRKNVDMKICFKDELGKKACTKLQGVTDSATREEVESFGEEFMDAKVFETNGVSLGQLEEPVMIVAKPWRKVTQEELDLEAREDAKEEARLLAKAMKNGSAVQPTLPSPAVEGDGTTPEPKAVVPQPKPVSPEPAVPGTATGPEINPVVPAGGIETPKA